MKNDIIIFPTDTVYGIGCNFDDVDALNKILDIKKRPTNKHFSVLCSSIEEANQLGVFDDKAFKIVNKFWPGALTVIVKTNEKYMHIYGPTIGLRVPDSKTAIDILKKRGPMATTSVNISGFPPLNDYDEIVKQFSKQVKKIYKPEEVSSNHSSTVCDLTNGIQIIRLGDISLEELKNV